MEISLITSNTRIQFLNWRVSFPLVRPGLNMRTTGARLKAQSMRHTKRLSCGSQSTLLFNSQMNLTNRFGFRTETGAAPGAQYGTILLACEHVSCTLLDLGQTSSLADRQGRTGIFAGPQCQVSSCSFAVAKVPVARTCSLPCDARRPLCQLLLSSDPVQAIFLPSSQCIIHVKLVTTPSKVIPSTIQDTSPVSSLLLFLLTQLHRAEWLWTVVGAYFYLFWHLAPDFLIPSLGLKSIEDFS